jgi:hypothetical protein
MRDAISPSDKELKAKKALMEMWCDSENHPKPDARAVAGDVRDSVGRLGEAVGQGPDPPKIDETEGCIS